MGKKERRKGGSNERRKLRTQAIAITYEQTAEMSARTYLLRANIHQQTLCLLQSQWCWRQDRNGSQSLL